MGSILIVDDDASVLGRLLRKIHPELPIHYISGFPEYKDSGSPQVSHEPGIHFRSKPFSPMQLLQSLNMILPPA